MNHLLRILWTLVLPLIAVAPTAAAISGSFIQPWLVADWDDARWQQEYAMLSEAGIHRLIFMHTVHTDKEGKAQAVYPTRIEGIAPGTNDLLDGCLRNAQKAGFEVIVGLNFDERWWNTSKWTPEWITEQMMLGNRVAQEITENYRSRYPGTLKGWYWVWEIEASFIVNSPELGDLLVNALNINLDCLTRLTPDLSVILSPFMNSQRCTAEAHAKVWGGILRNAHLKDGDILAPQDCVGSGFLKPEETAQWFKALAAVIPASPKINFWANIESFDQRFWTTAPLNRIKMQADNVAPYVSDMITFAYSHYYSPERIRPALHRAYCQWAKSSELPAAARPAQVNSLSIEKDGEKTLLKWTFNPQEPTLLGHHIYKDGILIGDVQSNHWTATATPDTATATFDLTGKGNGHYEVRAYNVIGEEAEKISDF